MVLTPTPSRFPPTASEAAAKHLQVVRSSGFSLLDEAALKSVRAWKFAASRPDFHPVTPEAEVPVRFRLTP